MQQTTTMSAVGEERAQVVRAARNGDPAAWRTLVDRYTGMLRSKCLSYRLGREDTSDVVQSTWLLAVQRLGQLRSDDSVGRWLATIAERECLKVVRRKGRETVSADLTDMDVADSRLPSPDREIARSWLSEVLPALIDQLPPSQRALLKVLTGTPELHYVDVARATGRPVGSIGPSRARCFARLRIMLENREIDASFLN
jgi:RNA polymerase sigma factor (sigma-70 family)